MTEHGIRHGGTFSLTAVPLPEHEARWPATDTVRANIACDWTDNDIGTARDIGQRLRNAAGEPYPSWRVVDIARMPASAPSTPITPTSSTEREVIPVSQHASLPDRSPDQPDEAPVAPPKPHAYPSREAKCAGCGVTFTSKLYKTGWTKYCSVRCANANIPRPGRANRAAPVERPAIAAEKWGDTRPPVEAPAASVATLRATDEASPFQPGAVITGGATYLLVREEPAATPPTPPLPRRALRPCLHTLLDTLPAEDYWTDSQRSIFLEALCSWLDAAIERRPDALGWRAGQ